MNLFKMLDFQRIHIFKKKRVLETCHPFAQPNCENKSLEPDHQIFELMSHSKIFNSDHQFLGVLSQKMDDFLRIINRVLKIFVSKR